MMQGGGREMLRDSLPGGVFSDAVVDVFVALFLRFGAILVRLALKSPWQSVSL